MTVLLRPLTENDLPGLAGGHAAFDDFGPRAPRSQIPVPELREAGGLAICNQTDTDLLGNVSWAWQRWGQTVESRNPMIGIWLRPEARGKGAGSDAQRALVDIFFRHTAVNRVEAGTDVENIAEQRALVKAGFTQEGTTRGAQWRNGAFHDCYLYSVLRHEWLGV